MGGTLARERSDAGLTGALAGQGSETGADRVTSAVAPAPVRHSMPDETRTDSDAVLRRNGPPVPRPRVMSGASVVELETSQAMSPQQSTDQVRVATVAGGEPVPVALNGSVAAPARVAACILLAGGLRQSPLTAAAGMSVLDLHITPTQTLLEFWLDRIGALTGHGGGEVRVMHCANTPVPKQPRTPGELAVRIAEDHQPYRGPAGIARDACSDLGPDSLVLIAEAGRLPAADLTPLLTDHLAHGADVTVGATPDGSPAGVYLARCSTISLVPARGFMDLKEQWLSRVVSRGLAVRVLTLAPPGMPLLRTRGQFVRAIRLLAGAPAAVAGFPTGLFPATGTNLRLHSVIAEGARVDEGALIVDSVVMPGAVVEGGSVVARSIVCPGAVVKRGEERVDAVVSASGVHSDSGALPRGTKERGR